MDFLNTLSFNLSLSTTTLFILVFSFVVLILFYILCFLFNKKLNLLQKQIRKEIRFSLQPNFIELSMELEDISNLATKLWALKERLKEIKPNLDKKEERKIKSSINQLEEYLKNQEIEVIDYTGEKFNEGLNLNIMNVEKSENIKEPTIKETVEPSIVYQGNVIKKAKVIVIKN